MFEKAILFCNGGKEDEEAIRLLGESSVAYVNLGPISEEEPTPFLEYGYWRFSGIQGIKRFIKSWEEKRLPPLNVLK